MTHSAQLNGTLIGFKYQADESAFAVAKIKTEDGTHLAVGSVGHAKPGQTVHLSGKWSFHPSFGEQFTVEEIIIKNPENRKGIILYLQNAGIQGLGKKRAEQIVAGLGLQAIEIIEQDPQKLISVKGIGKKTAAKFIAQWNQKKEQALLLSLLQGYGLGPKLAGKVLSQYQDDALTIVTKSPYKLSKEIKGVGFKTADKIALTQGCSPASKERMEAAAVHILREAEQQGHCCLPHAKFVEAAQKLELPIPQFEDNLLRMVEREELKMPKMGFYYHPIMYAVEKRVAQRLRHLLSTTSTKNGLFTQQKLELEKWERQFQLQLNEDQRQAIQMALENGISIITGGPGTGKTTIIRVLLSEGLQRGEKWLLAAPTGRAAKRMTESTKHPAQTIHRLLKFNGKGFSHDSENQLRTDCLLIDEASMLDIWLMDSIIAALHPSTRLILVGDSDQLPSVGPGQVLIDLIRSKKIPVTRLSEVYRQAQDSNIIRNAHRINQGDVPQSMEKDSSAGILRDFFILDRENNQQTISSLLECAGKRLPSLGFNPLEDIQILTPMHNGELGTHSLNQRLQELLNPIGRVLEYNEKKFRVGDRVLQLKNDYENDIFNGDVGRILDIVDDSIFVQFDNQTTYLSGKQLLDLSLAYAVSIHKSQGSEYPAVIVILHKAHWIMLKRNLLYTAITRARKFCCIIGSEWAVQKATSQNDGDERYTHLQERLNQTIL